MKIKAVLQGYPIYPGGSKNLVVADLVGPTDYAAATHDKLYASQFGKGGIDFIQFMNDKVAALDDDNGDTGPVQLHGVSFSGDYFVTVELAATTPDDAVPYVTIKWFDASTGAEVVGPADLSAEVVRAMMVLV